jgi:hypothetical protein
LGLKKVALDGVGDSMITGRTAEVIFLLQFDRGQNVIIKKTLSVHGQCRLFALDGRDGAPILYKSMLPNDCVI